jgi:hypothetical protein
LTGWLAQAKLQPKSEHKLLICWRTIFLYLAQSVEHGTEDVHTLAEASLSRFVKLLEKWAEDARFGSLIGLLGVGTSPFAPRFRLAAKAVLTFVLLRRNAAASARMKRVVFDWTGKLGLPAAGSSEQKERERLVSEWLALSKSKSYKEFASIVDALCPRLIDPALTIVGASCSLVDHLAGFLFPDIPWPSQHVVASNPMRASISAASAPPMPSAPPPM